METNLISALLSGDLNALANHPLRLNGRDAMFIGITVTLYINYPYVDGMNEHLCSCVDEYMALAPEPPKLGGVPGSRQWVDFSKRPFIGPHQAIAKLSKNVEWDLNYLWTKTDAEVAPWFVEVLRGPSIPNYALSYLHVTFPVNWMTRRELPPLVKTWSERLNVYHGFVGLSLLISPDQSVATALDGVIYIAAKKFPGLNVDDDGSGALYLMDGIKTVDWITILGKPFVDRLGGLQALHSRLTEFGVTPLTTGGLLIQTGKVPQLGDTGSGDPMKPYKDLNRILKTIRVKDYPAALQSGQAFQSGQTTEPYMDRDAARAWIARFDDK